MDWANETVTLQQRYQIAAAIYAQEQPGVPLALLDIHGQVVAGGLACADCCDVGEFALAQAAESLRWGQPAIAECPHGCFIWAVPVTDNNALAGCLVSGVKEPESEGQVGMVNQAARALMRAAIASNLANEALLQRNAEEAYREAGKAQAIHSLKDQMYTSVREIYLREEAALIAAIKSGEQAQAREILNRILAGVYWLGGRDFELLKALVLELVVVIYRTAVEAGGDPAELLGLNYTSLQAYASIETEEALSQWLVLHLERLMDSIRNRGERPVEVQLQQALRYMQEHCHEPLSRDDVARAAYISPSHLSHMVREKLDRSFVQLLNEMRLARAKELLRRTSKNLAQIALECGFTDQSYFTKVFRKYLGQTPQEYRRQAGVR